MGESETKKLFWFEKENLSVNDFWPKFLFWPEKCSWHKIIFLKKRYYPKYSHLPNKQGRCQIAGGWSWLISKIMYMGVWKWVQNEGFDTVKTFQKSFLKNFYSFSRYSNLNVKKWPFLGNFQKKSNKRGGCTVRVGDELVSP